MPDTLVAPQQGPGGMWSPDRPPSRGQWHSIAILALELLRERPPGSRLDASILIGRFERALQDRRLAEAEARPAAPF